MAFLVCLLFRESIGVAITKSFVIFVRKFFVSSYTYIPSHFNCVGAVSAVSSPDYIGILVRRVHTCRHRSVDLCWHYTMEPALAVPARPLSGVN